MGSLLGYARVSTAEQNADLQTDELTAAGCWRVYVDHASGALDRRPQLDRVLEDLRPGDTLVVWRLDRGGLAGPRRAPAGWARTCSRSRRSRWCGTSWRECRGRRRTR